MSSKDTYRPSNRGASLVHSSMMAARYSSAIRPRSWNGTPSSSNSRCSQPTPKVTIIRPLLIQSAVASALARTIGCWSGNTVMQEFRRIRGGGSRQVRLGCRGLQIVRAGQLDVVRAGWRNVRVRRSCRSPAASARFAMRVWSAPVTSASQGCIVAFRSQHVRQVEDELHLRLRSGSCRGFGTQDSTYRDFDGVVCSRSGQPRGDLAKR